MIRLAITGTDTGVGKTVVTCAIAAALRERSMHVTAMKPIETGVKSDDPTRDGIRIATAAGNRRPLSITAPIVLDPPISPFAASRRTGEPIDIARLDAAVENAAAESDALLIEGAGGLLVPVTAAVSFADLFRRWSLDLVVVAANRLGVINHTMLTIVAAAGRGLVVRAVVLNHCTAAAADESATDNLAVLRELLPAIPVVALPWTHNVDDLHQLAEHAEDCALAELVSASPAPAFVRRKG